MKRTLTLAFALALAATFAGCDRNNNKAGAGGTSSGSSATGSSSSTGSAGSGSTGSDTTNQKRAPSSTPSGK
jgi:hypothetical protein